MQELTTNAGAHCIQAKLVQQTFPCAVRQFRFADDHRRHVGPQKFQAFVLRADAVLFPFRMPENFAQTLVILIARADEQYLTTVWQERCGSSMAELRAGPSELIRINNFSNPGLLHSRKDNLLLRIVGKLTTFLKLS